LLEGSCVSLRQVQRYSSGEAPVPPSIAKLRRALIALGRVDVRFFQPLGLHVLGLFERYRMSEMHPLSAL
jgi:hypothetical protein